MKLTVKKCLIYLFLFVLALLCAVPFYTMLINATRSSVQIQGGISLIPGQHLAQNMQTIISKVDIFRGLLNSLIISASATALAAYIASLAAYGFFTFHFPGKTILFGIVLAMLMIPLQVLVIGIFQFANMFNLLDTYVMLIVPAGANAFTLFFIRQYMSSTLQTELLQAARIDGARELTIFHRIVLPLIAPAVSTISIFNFVSNWNGYLLPLTLLYTQGKFTMPLIIALLNTGTYRSDFGSIYLAVAISVVPVLLLFAVLSRYIISGISAGGVKE